MKTVTSAAELLAVAGMDLGHTEWMDLAQSRIHQFADATDDHQWIHVDEARAAEGPFGACIAHGYLTLALANCFLPQLLQVQNSKMGVNVGCDRVRFPAPVKAGSRIRGQGNVVSATVPDPAKPDAVQVIVRVTIEVEGQERPGCVVDTVSRFFF